jgi:CRP-like cAMP-binding protein
MKESLLKNIGDKGVALTTGEKELLSSFFKHRSFRKNQYLLQAGDVARYETFIIRGLTRTVIADEAGQEHVISFNAEDGWTGDLYSYFMQVPTSYTIDCLEATDVLQIGLKDLEQLFTTIPSMNSYFRMLYRNSLISYHQRVASTLCKPAAERYREFLLKYPEIKMRVPDHQIASFLGITPQSLSRIRRQVSQKK